MFRFSGVPQIVLSLCLITVSTLLTGHWLGVVPDELELEAQRRVSLAEAMAINCTLLAQKGDIDAMEAGLAAIVDRDDSLLSAGVRLADGQLRVAVADHAENWRENADEPLDESAEGFSDPSQIFVPLTRDGKRWARVELRFEPVLQNGLAGWFTHPMVTMTVFVMLSCCGMYYLYLRRVFRGLNPMCW